MLASVQTDPPNTEPLSLSKQIRKEKSGPSSGGAFFVSLIDDPANLSAMKLRYIPALIALAVLPFLLWHQSPEAKAAQRIRAAVSEAEAPVHVPGSGTREAEAFAVSLKAIDQSGAAERLRSALRGYIAAVESKLTVLVRWSAFAAAIRMICRKFAERLRCPGCRLLILARVRPGQRGARMGFVPDEYRLRYGLQLRRQLASLAILCRLVQRATNATSSLGQGISIDS